MWQWWVVSLTFDVQHLALGDAAAYACISRADAQYTQESVSCNLHSWPSIPSEFLWNWVHNLKLVLQWLCHMQGLRHVQQLGNVHLSESMKLSRLTCSICDEKGGLFVHFFQALENMFYLHSSNVPIRFGVILLSTKALEQNEAFKENSLIEDGSEEREAGIDVNDRQDLSTLVKLPEFPPSSFHCCDHCFLNFWCQMSTWLLSCFRV